MQGGCASAGRVRGKDPLLRVIHVSGTILHGQLRARRGIALCGRHSEQAGKQRSETMVAAHCKTFCEPGTNPWAYQVPGTRTQNPIERKERAARATLVLWRQKAAPSEACVHCR